MAHVILFTGNRNFNFTGVITPPAGAHRIRTFIEAHGYRVQVANFVNQWSVPEILQAIERHQDDLMVIGFSATFYQVAAGIFPAIKARWPTIPIVLGAPDPQPEQVPDIQFIDRLFYGHSETAFLHYLNSLRDRVCDGLPWRPHPRIGTPYIIAEHAMPHGDTADLHVRWKSSDPIASTTALSMETSRGCIFRCTFCAFPLLGKKKLDYMRSVESMADEFRYNYEHFGTTNYNFMDDTFNDTTAKLDLVLEAVRRAGINIRFCAYLRLDLLAIHPEMIDKLLDIGLVSATLGIETMDEPTRKRIGKGLSNEKLLATLAEMKRRSPQLRLSSGFIVGLPGESMASIIGTHEWLVDQCGRYLDSWYWSPLYIARKNLWLTSEFSRNYAKHGYEFPGDDHRWISPIMNFNIAEQLAQRFTEESKAVVRPGSFMVSELLSHGYSMTEISNMTTQTMEWAKLLANKAAIIENHKRMILGYAPEDAR